MKLDLGSCGCCCANKGEDKIDPLPNIDMLVEMTRNITSITYREVHSTELTLPLMRAIYEVVISKRVMIQLLNTT